MRALFALAALLCAACIGPYPNLAEKYDLGPTIGGAQTSWLLATATDTKILVLAAMPAGQLDAVFVLSEVDKHGDANVRSGQWELGSDGSRLTLFADLEQERKNESGTPVTSQTGSTRKNINDRYVTSAQQSASHLTLTGDTRVAGSWIRLETAFAVLAPQGEREAECALRFSQMQILTSQARVPGFGGGASIQYTTPATFKGALEGSLKVQVFGLFNPRTEETFSTFADFGGLVFDGQIITQTDTSGDGLLFGTTRSTFSDGAQTFWDGNVTYGQEDGSGDTLTLGGGAVTSGRYHVDVIGGASFTFPYTTILENDVLDGCFPE